jgi:hypothetical protein
MDPELAIDSVRSTLILSTVAGRKLLIVSGCRLSRVTLSGEVLG